jgi:hypothetical protein
MGLPDCQAASSKSSPFWSGVPFLHETIVGELPAALTFAEFSPDELPDRFQCASR